MAEVFKSLLFKYAGKLFLGTVNAEKVIDEFRTIEYNKQYDNLKPTEFVIVLVEKEDEKYKVFELNKITVVATPDSQEGIVIGEIPNDIIFSVANEVLENNKDKIVYH